MGRSQDDVIVVTTPDMPGVREYYPLSIVWSFKGSWGGLVDPMARAFRDLQRQAYEMEAKAVIGVQVATVHGIGGYYVHASGTPIVWDDDEDAPA